MAEQNKPDSLPEINLLEAALAKKLADTQASLQRLPDVKPVEVKRLAENFSKVIERSQRLIQRFMQADTDPDMNFSVPDPGIVGQSFLEMFQKLLADPNKLLQSQMNFWQDYMTMWQTANRRMLGEQIEPTVEPNPGDKRFKDPEWAENAVFDFIKQSYLLAARHLQKTANSVDGFDEKTAEKIDFYTRQFVDAMSPTNFAVTNPQVLKATLESGGENLVKGLNNLLADLDEGKGKLRIKMTDMDAFKLGENIAVTPGKVVYQTELMQLIQYNPSTEKVHKHPLLVIPPWINKFYILDLREDNSFIKWAVDQGFTVFVISWVNPDESLAEMDFEDYLARGTLAALDAIEKATGEREVNAVGYCIGGTLLFCTLGYMAAKRDKRIRSATSFTTMLDFTKVGEISVFIDEEQFAHIDKGMEKRGFLEGYHMGGVFTLMRANDLIWSFVIRNYLLGQEPFPFDLLYWNADPTRMPKAMHTFYLRNMYLNNRLKDPGGVSFLGQSIDLGKIKTPVFFLSTKEDHIAPWKYTYAGTRLPGGPVKFVLGESGHIAGVINPPTPKNKYAYWTNDQLAETPDEWFANAEAHPGSWWPHWLEWIKAYAGPKNVPARVPGDRELQPIEDAPGSYVKVRSQ
ncbi:MAG: class I poly(R)-hydroxyalkanoic acid synthase [Candidatus Competibacteraceae bacterium]|jgi:polyhydroxyalkanoate synthase|nr:class I poly(R)-hydroxyalkanoic acid synthase [Candidatus Competibacteraceae bacterium]